MPFTFPGPHTAAVGTRPRPLVGARPGQTGAMAAWMPQVPRRAPAPPPVPPALRPPSVMPVAPMAAQPAPYAGPSPWPAIPFNPYDPALPWPAPAMPLDPYNAPNASDVPGAPGPADVVLVDDRRTDASIMTSDADAVFHGLSARQHVIEAPLGGRDHDRARRIVDAEQGWSRNLVALTNFEPARRPALGKERAEVGRPRDQPALQQPARDHELCLGHLASHYLKVGDADEAARALIATSR